MITGKNHWTCFRIVTEWDCIMAIPLIFSRGYGCFKDFEYSGETEPLQHLKLVTLILWLLLFFAYHQSPCCHITEQGDFLVMASSKVWNYKQYRRAGDIGKLDLKSYLPLQHITPMEILVEIIFRINSHPR